MQVRISEFRRVGKRAEGLSKTTTATGSNRERELKRNPISQTIDCGDCHLSSHGVAPGFLQANREMRKQRVYGWDLEADRLLYILIKSFLYYAHQAHREDFLGPKG